MTIATTGIVVLATNAIDQSNLLTSRLLDTTVGVVVGLAVNLAGVATAARPGRVGARPPAAARARRACSPRWPPSLGPDLGSSDVEGWIRRCRELDVRIDEGWGLLRQAQESSRLNPRRSRPADLEDIERRAAPARAVRGRDAQPGPDGRHQRGPRDRLGRLLPLASGSELLTATATALDAGDPDQPVRRSATTWAGWPASCPPSASPSPPGRSTAGCWSTCATSSTPRSSWPGGAARPGAPRSAAGATCRTVGGEG